MQLKIFRSKIFLVLPMQKIRFFRGQIVNNSQTKMILKELWLINIISNRSWTWPAGIKNLFKIFLIYISINNIFFFVKASYLYLNSIFINFIEILNLCINYFLNQNVYRLNTWNLNSKNKYTQFLLNNLNYFDEKNLKYFIFGCDMELENIQMLFLWKKDPVA